MIEIAVRLAADGAARPGPIADRDDLEFTYSLIDRIFWLSLGELADFSGARVGQRTAAYRRGRRGSGPAGPDG